MDIDWPGVIDPNHLRESHVENIDLLANAAKAGEWDEVFRLVDSEHFLSVNQWRIGGRSWFTSLHQAAWLGAPVGVVDEFIRRGGWRSLRNADGERPLDVALKRGHEHLAESLATGVLSEHEQRKLAAWDRHLAVLIAERTAELEPVKIRPVPTEIIVLEPLENLYFGYPGMYGGFSMSTFKDRLLVESWCRVVGGSGQAHVITEGNCVLVEEGFI